MATALASHRALIFLSFLVCFVSTLLHIVAFSTSYWLVSGGSTPFVRMGFHEACFDNCYFPYCPGDVDIIFNGCYVWTFNELIFNTDQFRDFVSWLLPGWFMACRNVFIINLPLLLLCSILLLILTCWGFASRYTPQTNQKRDKCAIIMNIVALTLLIIATCLNLVGVAIFSSNGPQRNYMPIAYKNHFGFSYWLDFSVCVLLSICCITSYLATAARGLHFKGPKDPRYAEEMMLGRMPTEPL